MFIDRMFVGEGGCCWVWMLAICVSGQVRQEVGALARALCESCLRRKAQEMIVRFCNFA
jgi:hypothetical protein